MVEWLKKWFNYLIHNACPRCNHKLEERTEKHLDNYDKVEYSTPVQWCKHCGNKIYQCKFWFP